MAVAGEPPDVVQGVLRSFLDAASSAPWIWPVLALLVLRVVTRLVRAVVHGGHRRDPQRLFTGAARATVLSRAGHRCEHHSWLFGRCPATKKLQADHIHPHSRGGATHVANGQALCGRHNRLKAGHVPWGWQLERLARRRLTYYPPDEATRVIRHRA